MKRLAMTVMAVVLLTTVSLMAQETLVGNVRIERTSDGIRALVDRIDDSTAADGVFEDEFFLMVEPGTPDSFPRIELERAFIRATPNAVRIVDEHRTRMIVLRLGDADTAAPESRAKTDHDPESRKQPAWIETYEGYGLRRQDVRPVSDDEQAAMTARPRTTGGSACDAGASCGALSCSMDCGQRSCSTTCQAGYSACCWCVTDARPSCSCVKCS